MEYAAVAKLKAGQTLYMVSRKQGEVSAIHIHRAGMAKFFKGHKTPSVTGLTWMLMDRGNPVTPTPDADYVQLGFEACDGHMDIENFPVTLSRKQAIRWAREGYAIETGVWAVPEGYTIRFLITPTNLEDEAKLEAIFSQPQAAPADVK